jgi:hypothetical protein
MKTYEIHIVADENCDSIRYIEDGKGGYNRKEV